MQMRLMRWIEMIGIFFGMPLLLIGDIIPRPKIIALLIVCIMSLILLLRDNTFDHRRLGLNGFRRWRLVAVRFLVIAIFLTMYTILVEPEKMMSILRHDPAIWAVLVITYPVLSVIPQEIIYRAFFFHRYGMLFVNKQVSIVVNAALFAIAHVFFKNWVAVIGAFFAGLLWATIYLQNRSLILVSIEHALYGNLVFTLGIGYYFYAPDF